MRRRFGMAAASAALLAALVALPAGPAAANHFDEMQMYEEMVCEPEGSGIRTIWMDGDVPGEPSPSGPFFLNDLEVVAEFPFGFPTEAFGDATLTVLGGQDIELSDPEFEESFDDDALWVTWQVSSTLLAAPDTIGTHPIVPEFFSATLTGLAPEPFDLECDGFEDVGFADVTVVGPDEGPEGPPGPEGPEGPEGPPGADGQDGADGEDGEDGADGEDGTDGVDGADGADGRDGVAGGVTPRALTATPVGAVPTFTG